MKNAQKIMDGIYIGVLGGLAGGAACRIALDHPQFAGGIIAFSVTFRVIRFLEMRAQQSKEAA